MMDSAPQYPRPELPRLNFSGRFFTDPSTVNNNITYYDISNFRPNFQLLQEGKNPDNELEHHPDDIWIPNGYWNPGGNSSFAFVDCTVKAVTTKQGTYQEQKSYSDSLLGSLLVGNQQSVYGKISDLDPQNQFVSFLYGVRIHIRCKNNSGGHLSAVLRPCTQRDTWKSADGYGTLIRSLAAVYQGVLEITSFNPGDSEFLMECSDYIEKSKSATDYEGKQLFPSGALAIRFRVSDYDDSPSQRSSFRYGACVGIITPWLPGYPEHHDSGRILRCLQTDKSGRGSAYVHLQKNSERGDSYSLYLDMINSLERTTMSTYKDVGKLYLAFIPSGFHSKLWNHYHFIDGGEINYQADNWENETGGVVEIPIKPSLIELIEKHQLAIISVKGMQSEILLLEPSSGLFPRPDKIGVRLNPGETSYLDFYLSRYGRRVCDGNIRIGFDNTALAGTGASPEGGPTPGVPLKAITIDGNTPIDDEQERFEITVKTNANGFVRVPIEGGDCKNPRKYIDGQVYSLRYSADDDLPPIGETSQASDKITIKLFNVFIAPKSPSWISDIYPIFKQYANLYPGMSRVVDLDDFGSVVEKRHALERAFSAPEDDPRYMPVTRDLSLAKKNMILNWLKPDPVDPSSDPLYMNIDREADLLTALQTVIELEHATMPPYLTALYSIKPGTNQYIEDTLRDVAIEEMLHFALACNILIAIGGKPKINEPRFVPRYPGSLPGGLRRGLVVGLTKCTIPQLKAFMSLEAPNTQYLDDDEEVKIKSGNKVSNRYTIAFLYDLILDSLKHLHKKKLEDGADDPEAIYFPDDLELGEDSDDPRMANQVTGAFGDQLFKIRNLQDAMEAIDIIKEQGEGATPTEPSEGSIDKETGLPILSHFFRFAEIIKGRRLLYKSGGFSYTGPRIELDEKGVYNMRDNPKIENLPKGSLARERMESFSRKYQGLLNALHRTFNGDPTYLRQALACMHQLTMDARPLMEMPMINTDGTPAQDGTTVGISFQLPFAEDSA